MYIHHEQCILAHNIHTLTNKEKLTKLFQGWHPKFVIMIFTDGCGTIFDNLKCYRLCRQLHGIHTVDEGLEALIRKRRVTIIEFYDPLRKTKKEISTNHTNTEQAVTIYTVSNRFITMKYLFQQIQWSHSLDQIVEGV